jgi:diaminopimelate epimerase
VSVQMAVPEFTPARIPFLADAEADRYAIPVDGTTVEVGAVSMGNPHAVMAVRDVATAPVSELGPVLERHERFPRRANIGFMQVLGRDHIRLRVFERGAGETQACGTGACAAVVIGRRWQLLDPEVTVELPGGRLGIRWDGPGQPVWMTGEAVTVYEGTVPL